MNRTFTALVLALLVGSTAAADEETVLWYAEPAERWEEALPLGNGRIGAMVFGSTPRERLQLNEESLWAGEPCDAYPDEFALHLGKLQRLVLDGKILEAREYGLANLTEKPTSFRSFEPLGDLSIELSHAPAVEGYRRELDLQSGIVRVGYSVAGMRMTREILISAADDVVAVRLAASEPGGLSARIGLTRQKDVEVAAAGDDRLELDGQIVDVAAPDGYDDNPGGSGPGGEHMKFAARLLVRADGGRLKADGNDLVIEKANGAVLLLTAATDFDVETLNFDRSIDPGRRADRILARAAKKTWAKIVGDHVAEHRSLFDRVAIDLGGSPDPKRSPGAVLPTNERVAALREGADDPGLAALYFQYSRYLLMSSSRRPGRLPANLQGIWNDKMWAPWEADYHLNINLQMNYWPADCCNLSETIDPLADWLERLAARGTVSVKKLYGTDGWAAFTAVSVFGRTTPSGSTLGSQFQNGVLDPLAGAWMAMTLWRHYAFTRDEAFLAGRAYPVLKGAAEFVLHYLVEDGERNLVVVPSTSPENAYIHPDLKRAVRITRGSTYHTTIARVLFEAVSEAATILDTDPEFRQKLKKSLDRLPPLQIGKDGTIQEWIEDYEEHEPGHRHVSHLIGLHPFWLITPERKALFDAARDTIEKRGFGGDVGWSNAWKIAFFARLLDGSHWYVYRLIGRNAFPNLMDACWPGRTFQIDGNFGGCAGIAEMLLQSHGGTLHLLPALPPAWPRGHVRGLKGRGGFVVDLAWAGGGLTRGRVHSTVGGVCRVRSDTPFRVSADGQETDCRRIGRSLLEFPTESNRTYILETP